MDNPSDYYEWHCSRCGDEYPRDRDDSICEDCQKEIQFEALLEGVRCKRCDGHGRVYGTICDVQRAMNGRDTMCPECHGTGRVAWDPDLENVHPDLRAEARARIEAE